MGRETQSISGTRGRQTRIQDQDMEDRTRVSDLHSYVMCIYNMYLYKSMYICIYHI